MPNKKSRAGHRLVVYVAFALALLALATLMFGWESPIILLTVATFLVFQRCARIVVRTTVAHLREPEIFVASLSGSVTFCIGTALSLISMREMVSTHVAGPELALKTVTAVVATLVASFVAYVTMALAAHGLRQLVYAVHDVIIAVKIAIDRRFPDEDE